MLIAWDRSLIIHKSLSNFSLFSATEDTRTLDDMTT